MGKILVVDDEASVRHSVAAFLRVCGHEVREAANGVEALAELGRSAADVVITDINMPDMDGIEMVLALRDAATDVAVIAMSGGGLFGRDMLLDSASALGADVTLEKPLDLDVLKATVADLASRRSRPGDGV